MCQSWRRRERERVRSARGVVGRDGGGVDRRRDAVGNNAPRSPIVVVPYLKTEGRAAGDRAKLGEPGGNLRNRKRLGRSPFERPLVVGGITPDIVEFEGFGGLLCCDLTACRCGPSCDDIRPAYDRIVSTPVRPEGDRATCRAGRGGCKRLAPHVPALEEDLVAGAERGSVHLGDGLPRLVGGGAGVAAISPNRIDIIDLSRSSRGSNGNNKKYKR